LILVKIELELKVGMKILLINKWKRRRKQLKNQRLLKQADQLLSNHLLLFLWDLRFDQQLLHPSLECQESQLKTIL